MICKLAFAVTAVFGALSALCLSADAQSRVDIQAYMEAPTYDPHKVFHSAIPEVLSLLADTLVAVDTDLKTVSPLLAKSWTISADGKSYEFKLRNDVTFCDGKPFTSADVVATFARWLSPDTKSANKSVLGPLQEIVAKGADVVEFRFSAPYPDFLTQLAVPYASIIDSASVEKLGAQFGLTGFNGTGPYCWESWQHGRSVSMRRNPNYKWGPSIYENRGPAKIDQIVFKFIPDENTRISSMLVGQEAITYYAPHSSIARFKSDRRFNVLASPVSVRTSFIGVRPHRPFLQDLRVRLAISHAIDRSSVAKALYYGVVDPAYFMLPPNMDGALSGTNPNTRFDPELAGKLLTEAGWVRGADGFRYKDATRLRLVLIAFPIWQEKMEAVQGMLRAVGIDMQVEVAESAAYMSRFIGRDDYDMYAWYAAYNSVAEFFAKYSGKTAFSPYRMASGEQIDKLNALIAAGSSEVDAAKRAALFVEAQKLMADTGFYAPFIIENNYLIYNKNKISGVRAHSLVAGSGIYKGLDMVLR